VSVVPWARVVLKVIGVLLLGIFVQTTFANDLRVADVAPDFMLLLAVCGGAAAGTDAGAVIGFSAGLLSDLFLQSTPLGLSALAYCLVGFSAGWARDNLMPPRLVAAPALAAVGTGAGVTLFVGIGYVVGQEQLVAPGDRWLAQQAIVEALFAAVFALPAAVLMAWAVRRRTRPSVVSASGPAQPVLDTVARRRGLMAVRNRRRRRMRVRAR